jgi:hypothetical protein
MTGTWPSLVYAISCRWQREVRVFTCKVRGEPNLQSVAVSGLFDSFTIGEFGDVSFQWVALNQLDSEGEVTPRKLATATQPQFPKIVISLS